MSATRDNPAEALSGREIVNTRIFDAPREVVFKAFSTADHLAQWWGPRGFTNVFQQFEFRPGGLWRFVMRSPKGSDYPNESVFVEIIESKRIVLRTEWQDRAHLADAVPLCRRMRQDPVIRRGSQQAEL